MTPALKTMCYNAGMATDKRCSKCGETKPLDEFYQDSRSKNPDVRISWCKVCHRSHSRAKQRERTKARKARVLAAYGGCCSCCGESEPIFLTIHHIEGGGRQHRLALSKSHPKSSGGSHTVYRWLEKEGYPEGYAVLCWNCNAAEHFAEDGCPHGD